ncbi:putative double-stranded RNA-binding protein [Neofusicoccum parvum]|nr:putative double-stranded RNA-binding protein [Neofusicoccum parvum]
MASQAFPQKITGLGASQAQSIEDWEAQMADASKQELASTAAAHAVPSSSDPPPPFKAGRVWSSEPVATFNNLCLKHAVANAYDYAQTRPSPPGWAVTLNFRYGQLIGGGEDFNVSLAGPYGSKKEAKAAAAEEGVKLLTEALAKAATNKRKKADDDTGVNDDAQEGSDDENENWIGLLCEYCQAAGKARPMFQEFSLGANYSMECTLSSEEGADRPFGDRHALFNNKKAAKAHAARDAVRWLRDRGRMPRKGHPTKKKAKAAAAATVIAVPPSAGLAPLPAPMPISGVDANAPAPAAGAEESDGSSAGSPDHKDRSLGEQVMMLCSRLGVAQPVYRITPDPRVPSMWSGAAFFPHDPAMAPPGQAVGEVANIYGKKNAKEEVAKKVLKHLKAKRAERLREAEGVLAGVGAASG